MDTTRKFSLTSTNPRERAVARELFSRYDHRWVLYIYAFVTVSFVGGTVYGWPALRRKLKDEGSELSEDQLGAVFTVGAWSSQGLRFFVGFLRDKYGTRLISVSTLLCSAAGFAGAAWSSHDSVVALAVSMFLMGTGSCHHLVSVSHNSL